jgi:hypothetical protein
VEVSYRLLDDTQLLASSNMQQTKLDDGKVCLNQVTGLKTTGLNKMRSRWGGKLEGPRAGGQHDRQRGIDQLAEWVPALGARSAFHQKMLLQRSCFLFLASAPGRYLKAVILKPFFETSLFQARIVSLQLIHPTRLSSRPELAPRINKSFCFNQVQSILNVKVSDHPAKNSPLAPNASIRRSKWSG